MVGTANPTQLLTAKHKEMRALYTQMGLSVSRSPVLALAQEGQPARPSPAKEQTKVPSQLTHASAPG